MLAKISTLVLDGLAGSPVTVEVDIGFGLPSFTIVGLANAAILEARERVRSALRNANFPFPQHRLTVNLAPANLKKNGSQLDLPIAVGILVAQAIIAPPDETMIFIGELSLNGDVRPVQGLLPSLLSQQSSVLHHRTIYIPAANQAEARLAVDKTRRIFPIHHIKELVDHLTGKQTVGALQPADVRQALEEPSAHQTDFAMIHGQYIAKRALTIAAAGGHNILLSGPPGTGKTLLAKALPSILPKLAVEEALAITQLYSVAGLLDPKIGIVRKRPFRAPHHTASAVAITGGGSIPRPGEISLAHLGVLFLDELAEFPTAVLEVLRQPLEDRVITIARAAGSYQFPADFMLIGALNPCPCGYHGDSSRQCSCRQHEIIQYNKRLSGPLIDRIDLHLTVKRLPAHELMANAVEESSVLIQKRVEQARDRQRHRFRQMVLQKNASMGPNEIKRYCQLTYEARAYLGSIVEQYQLSGRGYYRLIKVSQTIADLNGSDMITLHELTEACQYRLTSTRA